MPDSDPDLLAAKDAIRAMLAETPRPTQRRISLATGLTQGYVAKINRCEFTRLNDSIRKVVAYARMTVDERAAAEAGASGTASRIGVGAARLAARDAALAEAVADFVERLSRLP